MNFIKLFIIELAYKWVSKRHEEHHEAVEWSKEDSIALDSFLKTDSGKKFLGMMGQNANRALQQVVDEKDQNKIEGFKAQAKVWNALKSNLTSLRVQRRDPKSSKLSPEKLEEIFSKMVSSSIQVTRHSMR